MTIQVYDIVLGTTRSLDKGELTIGKQSDCDVQLKDKGIKSVHVTISLEGSFWVIRKGHAKAEFRAGGRAVEEYRVEKETDLEIGRFRFHLKPSRETLQIDVFRPHGFRDLQENVFIKSDDPDHQIFAEDYFYQDGTRRRRYIKYVLNSAGVLITSVLVFGAVLLWPSLRVLPSKTKMDDTMVNFMKVHRVVDEVCFAEKQPEKLPDSCGYASTDSVDGEVTTGMFSKEYHAEKCALCHKSSFSNQVNSNQCTLCHLRSVALEGPPADCIECHFEHRKFDHTLRIELGQKLFKASRNELADLGIETPPAEGKGADSGSWLEKIRMWSASLLDTPYTYDNAIPSFVDKSCFDCHKNGNQAKIHEDIPEFMRSAKWEMKFPHETHLLHEERCVYCHVTGKTTRREDTLNNCFECHKDPLESEEGDYCYSCHRYHHSSPLVADELADRFPGFDKGRLAQIPQPENIPGSRLIKEEEAAALEEKPLTEELYPGSKADDAAASKKMQGDQVDSSWGDDLGPVAPVQ